LLESKHPNLRAIEQEKVRVISSLVRLAHADEYRTAFIIVKKEDDGVYDPPVALSDQQLDYFGL
jgi:hypothetical protein